VYQTLSVSVSLPHGNLGYGRNKQVQAGDSMVWKDGIYYMLELALGSAILTNWCHQLCKFCAPDPTPGINRFYNSPPLISFQHHSINPNALLCTFYLTIPNMQSLDAILTGKNLEYPSLSIES
jgi:hypothetical protein